MIPLLAAATSRFKDGTFITSPRRENMRTVGYEARGATPPREMPFAPGFVCKRDPLGAGWLDGELLGARAPGSLATFA
jgi:hypothetical protein